MDDKLNEFEKYNIAFIQKKKRELKKKGDKLLQPHKESWNIWDEY